MPRVTRRWWLSTFAVGLLMGCPRPVPRDDGGPPPIVDAGPPPMTDAGEPAINAFDGPITFNDEAVRYVDPSTLSAGNTPCRAPVLVHVTSVVDGDTFHATGVSGAFNGTVRIIGIDAPEIAHDGMPQDCYGPQAQSFTRQLDEHLVWLTFDTECFDRFDRVLAYVHTGPDEGGFWERQLLRRGLATTLSIAPNVTFEPTFEADESRAASANAGLWGSCP